MLGWAGFKYRTEVIVNIHSILFFVPELKKLLKTFPKLSKQSVILEKQEKPSLKLPLI